jgi:hypothetical protein
VETSPENNKIHSQKFRRGLSALHVRPPSPNTPALGPAP